MFYGKNIKCEHTYSEPSSLVKLKLLYSDIERYNKFYDDDSEHFSRFNGFNDNIINSYNFEIFNILRKLDREVYNKLYDKDSEHFSSFKDNLHNLYDLNIFLYS